MRILDILGIFRRVCLLACLFTFVSFLFYSPFCCRTTHRSSFSPSGMLGLQPEPTSQVQLGFKPFLCASSPLHPLPSNLSGNHKGHNIPTSSTIQVPSYHGVQFWVLFSSCLCFRLSNNLSMLSLTSTSTKYQKAVSKTWVLGGGEP